jgi:hypothetical protein
VAFGVHRGLALAFLDPFSSVPKYLSEWFAGSKKFIWQARSGKLLEGTKWIPSLHN